MVVHPYNPSIQEAEAGGLQAQGQLGYIVRSCCKKITGKKKNLWRATEGRC
jgi:hypothetical protein